MIVVGILVVITVCLFVRAFGTAMRIDKKIRNTSTVMEKTLKDYFSKIGNIDYYTLEEKSSLSPIGNEETYIIKEKDGQFFVKLQKDYAVYDPTIHTIVKQVEAGIVPTCYLFKFRKKGEELWRRVYIIVVSPRNIDYKFKTE